MLQAPGGLKNFGMFVAPSEGQSIPGGIRKRPRIGVCAPVSVDHEPTGSMGCEVVERVGDEGFVRDWDQGFRPAGGERFESGAETSAENKCGIGSLHRSIDAELAFSFDGDPFGIPWRVPYEIHVCTDDTGKG